MRMSPNLKTDLFVLESDMKCSVPQVIKKYCQPVEVLSLSIKLTIVFRLSVKNINSTISFATYCCIYHDNHNQS